MDFQIDEDKTVLMKFIGKSRTIAKHSNLNIKINEKLYRL